jgi:hypothetical protein
MALDVSISLAPEQIESLMDQPAVLAAGVYCSEHQEALREAALATYDVLDALAGYNPLAALVGLITAVGTLAGNIQAGGEARPRLRLVKGGEWSGPDEAA